MTTTPDLVSSTAPDPAAATGRPGPLSALDRLPVLSLPVLTGLLLLRTALLFALVGVLRLVLPNSGPDGLILTNALIMVVDVATLGAVIMVLRRGRVGLGELLGRFRARDLLWTVLITVITLAGFLVASFTGNLIAYGGPPPLGGETLAVPLWVGVGAIPAALTIGVAEEALYRGVGQDQLTRRLGALPALVIVSGFFALQHVPLALLSGPAVLAKVIMTFLVGLLLGALMIKLRRLWPLIVAHAVVDLIFLSLPTLLLALA